MTPFYYSMNVGFESIPRTLFLTQRREEWAKRIALHFRFFRLFRGWKNRVAATLAQGRCRYSKPTLARARVGVAQQQEVLTRHHIIDLFAIRFEKRVATQRHKPPAISCADGTPTLSRN